jgi:hypothetical protein
MKLTVNTYLNARIGSATVTAPCEFYRSPGNTISVDYMVTGEEVDGNSIWYHCSDDGCFYWSGGIAEVEFEMIKIKDFTGNKHTLLNEAIQYSWNKWRKTIAGLTGVHTGKKLTGEMVVDDNAIVFQVVKKQNLTPGSTGIAPKQVYYRGVCIDTDVVQASIAQFQTINPGAGISRIKEIDESGTVALKVFRREGEKAVHYLLTNYHVAAFDLLRNDQFRYRFPPNIPNRQVMVPAQKTNPANNDFIGSFSEGRLSPLYDIALILLNDENEASNTVDGFTIKEFIDVQTNARDLIGSSVTLYGAFSGKKISPVVSVHSHQVFGYAGGNTMELLELIQVNRFSGPGDSGSPVVLNGKIIGIHVGADDNFSYAIPIKRVLDFYKLKISQS